MFRKLHKGDQLILHKIFYARTFFQRLMGLMFKKDMLAFDGLFIPDCKSIHTCFMRFEIDVLFLDKDLNIIKIIESLKPWRLTNIVFKAMGVLELPGGSVSKYGLKVGDLISFEAS